MIDKIRAHSFEGKLVKLIPLSKSHYDELYGISCDKRIWEFMSVNLLEKDAAFKHFDQALEEEARGTQFPFIIYHKEQKKIIGSTRYMDIQPQHRKLEIGWTWLHPDYWKGAVNADCKLMLLRFCFEELDLVRVQLKANEKNLRSRSAIAKIGATFEGVLRQDMIKYDGTLRNSAYYGIIDSEWPAAKRKIEELFQSRSTF